MVKDLRVLLAELSAIDIIGETSASTTSNSSMRHPAAFFPSHQLKGNTKSSVPCTSLLASVEIKPPILRSCSFPAVISSEKHHPCVVSEQHQRVIRTVGNMNDVHRGQYLSRYLTTVVACSLRVKDRVLLHLSLIFPSSRRPATKSERGYAAVTHEWTRQSRSLWPRSCCDRPLSNNQKRITNKPGVIQDPEGGFCP